jgi:hypothetical protein
MSEIFTHGTVSTAARVGLFPNIRAPSPCSFHIMPRVGIVIIMRWKEMRNEQKKKQVNTGIYTSGVNE